jgi:hypothetical protein
MSIFLGYYRTNPTAAQENDARARTHGPGLDPKMRQLVLDLPGKLPKGCRILGSYVPMAEPVFGDASPPSVMIVETGDTADLQFIAQHYASYLIFQFMPAISVGTTRAERDAAIPQPAGGR